MSFLATLINWGLSSPSYPLIHTQQHFSPRCSWFMAVHTHRTHFNHLLNLKNSIHFETELCLLWKKTARKSVFLDKTLLNMTFIDEELCMSLTYQRASGKSTWDHQIKLHLIQILYWQWVYGILFDGIAKSWEHRPGSSYFYSLYLQNDAEKLCNAYIESKVHILVPFYFVYIHITLYINNCIVKMTQVFTCIIYFI